MNTWTHATAPGELERQVTDLLDHAARTGLQPDAVVLTTARVLCLLALAARPVEATTDEVKGAVMRLVWDALAELGGHPFAGGTRSH